MEDSNRYYCQKWNQGFHISAESAAGAGERCDQGIEQEDDSQEQNGREISLPFVALLAGKGKIQNSQAGENAHKCSQGMIELGEVQETGM